MKQKTHYLQMDVWRCISSGKLAIGAVGVFLALLVASGNVKGRSVFDFYTGALYGVPFLLTMAFCACSYADCFCDDLETKYINFMMARGNLKNYTFSKIIVIFLSSVVTMVLGVCIYVLVLHIWLPWNEREGGIYTSLMESGGFRFFLEQECYFSYFLLVGVQMGLLAAVLSLFAAYISLYISNKLLVMSVPLIGYYLLYYYVSAFVEDIPALRVKMIFDATYWNIWENDWLSFLYAVLVSVILGGILSIGIYRKIRRKLERE